MWRAQAPRPLCCGPWSHGGGADKTRRAGAQGVVAALQRPPGPHAATGEEEAQSGPSTSPVGWEAGPELGCSPPHRLNLFRGPSSACPTAPQFSLHPPGGAPPDATLGAHRNESQGQGVPGPWAALAFWGTQGCVPLALWLTVWTRSFPQFYLSAQWG